MIAAIALFLVAHPIQRTMHKAKFYCFLNLIKFIELWNIVYGRLLNELEFKPRRWLRRTRSVTHTLNEVRFRMKREQQVRKKEDETCINDRLVEKWKWKGKKWLKGVHFFYGDISTKWICIYYNQYS